ncbi:MAG: acylphosphatase [Candidatus Hydrogenedentes bacterium]|nr:acylphosphatase [Candidatus Hydrogenedentota bacterium]
MSHRIRLLIDGRVQGVGYRYSACAEARRLGLDGWVRNLGNGQVELEAEGDEDGLEQLTLWCHRGPLLAEVRHVEVVARDSGEKRYKGFLVR